MNFVENGKYVGIKFHLEVAGILTGSRVHCSDSESSFPPVVNVPTMKQEIAMRTEFGLIPCWYIKLKTSKEVLCQQKELHSMNKGPKTVGNIAF